MSTPSWPSLYNLGIEIIDIPHNAPIQPHAAYLHHPIDVFRFTLFWTLIFYCPVFIFCGCYAFWNLNFPPAPRPHNVRSTPESRRLPKRRYEQGNDEFWPPGISTTTAYPLSPLKPTSSKPEPPPPPKPPPPTHQGPATLPSTSSSFPTLETFRSTTPFLPRTRTNATPPVQTQPSSSSSSSSRQNPKHKDKGREGRNRFTFALLVLLTFFAAGLAGAVLGSAIVGFVAAAFFRSTDYNMSTWIPFFLALLMVLTGYLSLWPSIIDII